MSVCTFTPLTRSRCARRLRVVLLHVTVSVTFVLSGDRVWICWDDRIVAPLLPAHLRRTHHTSTNSSSCSVATAAAVNASATPDATMSPAIDVVAWRDSDVFTAFFSSLNTYASLSLASNLHLAWLDYRLHLGDTDGAQLCYL